MQGPAAVRDDGDPNATDGPRDGGSAPGLLEVHADHGIDFPDPQFDGGGVRVQMGEGIDPTSEAFKDAQEACGDMLPGGVPGGVSTGPATEAKP